MKLGLSLVFVAIVLPALSSAFLFGVTLTNTAGATLLALNPTAVGTLATVGVAGAALAGLGALALARPPRRQTTRVVKTSTRRRPKYRHRGRRDSAAATSVVDSEVYDAIFVDLAENKVDGCFQRLVCDIAASPAGFEKNLPILNGVQLAGELTLSPLGRDVADQLLKAMQFGSDLKSQADCEAVFNRCDWTGADMERVIEDMKNQV